MANNDWLDPNKLATQFAPGAWGQQTPVRDGAPQQQPQQQQPQQQQFQPAQPAQQQVQQPRQENLHTDWANLGGGNFGQLTAAQYNQLYGTNYDPTYQDRLSYMQGLYNQGNETVSDFLNGFNGFGGNQGGGFQPGNVLPDMGGLLPAGLPQPGGGQGTTVGGGWPGWNAPPIAGLGDYQIPSLLDLGINPLDLGDVGQYGSQDNTLGLGLTGILLNQVPPPGGDSLPTPGQRFYNSGITGGTIDTDQLAGIRQPLQAALAMPNIPGMTGDQMGALGAVFGQSGSDALAGQRNAYDINTANQLNALENNRQQALAGAGLAGQQFGINRELQDLRRYNTNANMDNSLQQSAIQAIMAALGNF